MTPSILEIAVKSTAIMAVAALAAGLMRRRGSAASRHLVWSLAVAAVLILPIASLVVPSLEIPIRRATMPAVSVAPIAAVTKGPVAEAGPSAAPIRQGRAAVASIEWMAFLPLAYAAGVVLLLGRLGVEHWRTRRMLSRTTVLDDPAWTELLNECMASLGVTRPVRLARSREEAMPMTCGARRPVIVIPSIAGMWDEDRRRAVLLHELAHVVRFDCLTQTLAQVAVAFYWAHPGSWWMARRLRVERELACDDCVLSSGTEPREYAGHLLEIAHSLGGYQAPALAVGMARPRQLEGRMLAMLDTTRNRTTPALGRRVLAGILAGAVVAPLAAATVVPVAWTPSASPSPQRSSFTGRLGAVGAAVAPIASATPLDAGTWQIRLSEDGRSVYLTISTRPGSSHGTTIPLDRIEGLAAILTGPGGPSRYTLKRDAGTFDFEGIVRSGAGGGTFTFTPNAAFADELVRRGFSKPGALELGVLAWSDMGFAFLDELNAMKYERPTLEPLVNAAQHGVSLAYLRDLSSLGYRVGTLAALVRLRDHGVDAAFVRGMQAESLNSLSVDDLVRSRDHGIDPAYVRDLRALGYVLNLDQLVDARNHGIDPGYVREMGAAGFAKLSLDDLVNARNHGIDPRYVLDLQALGFKGLSLDQLVDARNHGIDPGYIREMGQLGYRLPLEALVRARDHGIDATTVQQMKSRGVDRPSIDRLIELHDRGANAGDALVGPHLQASGSLKASVQTVLHDASAAVSRWADRWLK